MGANTENLLDRPDCADCGHGFLHHYNTKTLRHSDDPRPSTGRQPCHKMGRHDSRCQCRNYRAPEGK